MRLRSDPNAGVTALSAFVGVRAPEHTDLEHAENQRNGALLVWLAFRDIHYLRQAITGDITNNVDP